MVLVIIVIMMMVVMMSVVKCKGYHVHHHFMNEPSDSKANQLHILTVQYNHLRNQGRRTKQNIAYLIEHTPFPSNKFDSVGYVFH